MPQHQTGTACCSNKSCDLNQHCGPAVQTASPPEEKRKLLPETSSSIFFPHSSPQPGRLLWSTDQNLSLSLKKSLRWCNNVVLVLSAEEEHHQFFQWPLINLTPPSDLLVATLSKYLDVSSHQVINHSPHNTGLQFKRDACNGQIKLWSLPARFYYYAISVLGVMDDGGGAGPEGQTAGVFSPL